MRHTILALLGCCVMALVGLGADTPRVYKVMILDGMNNHQWQTTTPAMEQIFKDTGRFEVTVVTTPPAGAPLKAWKKFQPQFAKYDAVVLNWNDFGAKRAADVPAMLPWMEELEQFVSNGGGLVVYHAAGPEHLPQWAKMCGLVWQKASFGDRITIDNNGKMVRTLKGQGPGSGHGKHSEFVVTIQDKDHPICAGMPVRWKHVEDEAWFGQRGPAENMQVLVTACPPKTNQNEPMVWTVSYGKGRVFVNRLGHGVKAMTCVGFRALLARGCEWTITGKTTMALPENFPTETKTVSIAQGK